MDIIFMAELDKVFDKLKNEELEKEAEALKEHLKRYTMPERNRKYYENNKEKVKQKVYEARRKKREEAEQNKLLVR